MSITPPALVPSAPRPALPFGLFSVVAPRVGSSDRWEGGGIQLEELGCPPAPGGGYIGPFNCDPEGDTVGLPKSFDGHATLSEATQFTIYQSEVCTPIGNSLERPREIAEARLTLFEELLVERALWAILVADAALTGTFALSADKSAVLVAIAALEKAAATAYGTQGAIHMPRDMAMVALGHGALEKRQGRLFTLLDTPVIAGSGYSSAAPIMYWTPQIVAYRTETFNSQQASTDLLDRAQNNLYAVAERLWVLGFDTSCGVFTPPTP